MSKKEGLTTLEIDKAKILLASGKSPNAVAKALRRDPKTIRNLAKQSDIVRDIDKLKTELATAFEDLAERMVDSITDQDITKLNALQRVTSAGIAVDKAKGLRGEERPVMNIIQINTEMEKLQTELFALVKRAQVVDVETS